MARKQVKAYSRANVMHSLLMAKPALGKGTFVPVLNHFCFDGENVCAYDDSIAISVPLSTPFSCAIPGDLMLKLLSTMVADDMDMEVVENAVRVTCGRSTMKLPMLPEAAFLFKSKAVNRALGSVPVSSALIDGLTKCLLAVGNDPTHPAQMGITLRADSTGGTHRDVCLYSTDNVTMSEYVLDETHTDESFLPDGGVIMPTEFCRQLIALHANTTASEETRLMVNEGSVSVSFPGAFLFGKLIVVEKPLDFPSVFERMMPNAKSKRALVPSAWDSAFTRAAAVVNPAHPITTVTCEDGVITVESSSPIGETVDTLELGEGETFSCKPFTIDPLHVIRASKVCSQLEFQPKALVMQDPDARFTHLISHCVE